jgi:hypothetical protein
VILALAASVAIVVLDHASLRAAPRAGATELTILWQGELLEVRGEHAGYLKVYDYGKERGGYIKSESLRPVDLTENGAPELLAVVRFLRDTSGSEALGIGYGAAYLKAAPGKAVTSESVEAIARMAERLADDASRSAKHAPYLAQHLEVVAQFGVHMRRFERNNRMQVCYDGELFRRLLTLPAARAEERAHAALGLTRPECIDPSAGPTQRAALDEESGKLLDAINDVELSAMTRSRVHARRAVIWASIAFERARRGEPPGSAADRAMAEVLAVDANEFGDDHRAQVDALLRVSAIRWATQTASATPTGPLNLSTAPGEPGQTCITLNDARRSGAPPLVRRCTYGIVWIPSAHTISQGAALALAVQPLDGWRELWVFHPTAGTWRIDVLSPGTDDPDAGYVDFAGYAPATRRLHIAREVKTAGRFQRRFEELRLDDLTLVRGADSPDALRDFGWWQDAGWRRDTLALR